MLLLAVLVSVAIACDGPCVRFLSSDFDLRLAFASHTVSPDVYSGADNPGHLRVDGSAAEFGLAISILKIVKAFESRMPHTARPPLD